MPYMIRKRTNKYCVIKTGATQEIIKCHDTIKQAEDHKIALDIATAGEKAYKAIKDKYEVGE